MSSISQDDLVKRLADKILEPVRRGSNNMVLTQMGGILVESAGIDSSNGNGYFVLLPKDPYKTALLLWKALRKRDKIKHLGIVIADSHSVPRRKGAISFALASYGFMATNVYAHEHDIFGKKFRFTATDVADSLAATAGLAMGEGAESTPVVIISQLSSIKYFNKIIPLGTAKKYSWVHPDLDVYSPLLSSNIWKKRPPKY